MMLKLLKRFVKEESGQAMVEYGLIIAVVALAVVGALALFRDKIKDLFDRAGQQLDGAETAPAP